MVLSSLRVCAYRVRVPRTRAGVCALLIFSALVPRLKNFFRGYIGAGRRVRAVGRVGGPSPWSPGSLPFGLSRVRARLRCCRRLVPLDSSRICYTDSFQVSAVPLSGPLVPVRAGCSSSVSVLSFRLCGSSWRCFRSASLPGLPPLPPLYGVGGVLWWGVLIPPGYSGQ